MLVFATASLIGYLFFLLWQTYVYVETFCASLFSTLTLNALL